MQQSSPWLVFRHVKHEHIGTLAHVLAAAGIAHRYVDVFRGEKVPEDPFGSLGFIVMGGPMGVYEADRFPFLRDEQRLIRQAAESGLPVLGICLGAQLIAAALGARVYPGPRKEIGWYPVEVTTPAAEFAAGLPSRFMAFHWHGDTFDLPPGATPLFRSDLYENQGFRWGRNVLAIQFHLEVTAAMVDEWLADGGCRRELAEAPDVDPAIIRQQTAQWGSELERLGQEVFGRFLHAARRPLHEARGDP
jgi:GMP synthase (glutamine-hydrolysing)